MCPKIHLKDIFRIGIAMTFVCSFMLPLLVIELNSNEARTDVADAIGCPDSEIDYTGCYQAVATSTFDEKIKADGLFAHFALSVLSCRILNFLYTKNVYGCLTDECSYTRRKLFFSVLDPAQRATNTSLLDSYHVLCDLVSEDRSGDAVLDYVPIDTLTFAKAMVLPQWSNPHTSYIFHRDDPSIVNRRNVLIQRVQKSNNCYIHASTMAQHYAIAKHNKTNMDHEILDITGFVKSSFGPIKLQEYIFRNVGSDTIKFLRSILHRDSEVISYSISSFDLKEDMLQKYGPAIVASFMVDDKFGANGNLVYTGRLPRAVYLRNELILSAQDVFFHGRRISDITVSTN
jgi:hypothetical protein